MSFLNLPVISLLFKNSRSISTISGYITISEITKDELEITQHPVQYGSTITDHAFIKPTLLNIQIQFDRTNILSSLVTSAASALGGLAGGVVGGVAAGLAGGILTGAFNNDILSQTYKKLVDLQNTRQPFDVATPKRVYKNMLFQSLGLTTNKDTENVLSISAVFQQIIIVQVSTTTTPRTLQKFPGLTGATENAGKKSALFTVFGG